MKYGGGKRKIEQYSNHTSHIVNDEEFSIGQINDDTDMKPTRLNPNK